MTPVALPLLTLAVALTAPIHDDWIQAGGAAACSGTDVDFSDPQHGFASCAFSSVMVTDNGGLDWRVLDTGLQQSLVFAHAVGTDDLYAARLGLYHSTDRGVTWRELGDLSANFGSVFDVHFGEGGRLVAIQGGTLLVSDDGGSSWQTAYPGEFGVYFDELHFPAAQTGYATGGNTTEQGSAGSVLRSDDGGTSWTLLPFTHGEIVAADFFDANAGVVATQQAQMYATADGGSSWQLLGPLPDGAILLDLAHRGPEHWYGVSIQGCLYETRNAGVDWQTGYCDAGGRALAAMTVSGGAAVAVGNDGLALYENRIFRDGLD